MNCQDILKSAAPLLGTALGGPLGGAAAAFLADKLGLDGSTVENVTQALESGKLGPEQLAQIKIAEIEFQKFCRQNGLDLAKVDADDRRSARELLATTKARTPAVLTYVITVGFFGVLGAMFIWPEVKESAPLMIMLGSLGTAWTGACAFWFGTTHNSQQKTDLLANSAPVK